MQPSDKEFGLLAQEQIEVGDHLLFGALIGHHNHHIIGQLIVNVAGWASGAQLQEFGLHGALSNYNKNKKKGKKKNKKRKE